MKTKKQILFFLITIFICLIVNNSIAQSYQTETNKGKSNFQWPEGKKMALSFIL